MLCAIDAGAIVRSAASAVTALSTRPSGLTTGTLACVSPSAPPPGRAPHDLQLEQELILLLLGTRAVYKKYVARSAEDRQCVGVFAAVRLEDGTCRDMRVAVGAASETPQRFRDSEAMAVGQPLDADAVKTVADGYAERIDTLAEMRGSAWYRTEMVRVWVRRALEHASGMRS